MKKGLLLWAWCFLSAAVLLKWKNDWDWFVNLDASDYPLIPQDDFLHILSFVPRNLNFIEYNKNTSRRYQKAAEIIVDSRLYILLKRKMFVGDKRALPSSFRLFMTLACNTKEFSDAVINSNLRFINSDNTARDPLDFRAPNSDRILKREVAFVGNISADSPLLDMIDAHILHRGEWYGLTRRVVFR
ncbi:hypothetical protein HAX54_049793 [Datura stramonium]|uniref:Uncharacterized protein n=1 Tax=Datura stramonium TaxID=4076 RepID=A0ABS8SVF9_DATST|nr:hypothetical protein [Datura stramonium]